MDGQNLSVDAEQQVVTALHIPYMLNRRGEVFHCGYNILCGLADLSFPMNSFGKKLERRVVPLDRQKCPVEVGIFDVPK